MLPTTGWTDDRVEDMKGEEVKCQYCNKESIRFVHVLTHPDYEGELKVGCICAGKLTGNLELSKKKERERKNESRKVEAWRKKHDESAAAKKEFLDSFVPIPNKENWYKGKIGNGCCIVWRGFFGECAFGISEDPNHQFVKKEWTWTNSEGFKIKSISEAKNVAWEHYNANKIGPLFDMVEEDNLPTRMKNLAQKFPELGVSAQDAYVFGKLSQEYKSKEALEALKLTGYKYYKDLAGHASGTPILRIMELAYNFPTKL